MGLEANHTIQCEHVLERGFEIENAVGEFESALLGSFDCGLPCGAPLGNDVSFKTDIIRGGLNYRF